MKLQCYAQQVMRSAKQGNSYVLNIRRSLRGKYLPAKRLVKKALVSRQLNERLLAASFKRGSPFRNLRNHPRLPQG